MYRRCVILSLVFFITAPAFAQQNYPQNYFRNPLNIPIQLAANFGEVRKDHFHMGLDIRTQSRENLPVYAAAEGYVSRIKIEKRGYGQAIYITHPNGYTTLYAHLNSFYKELNDYIIKKQYQDESWEQDFALPKNLFRVTKGQFIANSGNTGGSQGPHLHFEIRDTKTENNLNPRLFGFDIPDNIPPAFYGLYWYDRRYSVYRLDANSIAIAYKNGSYTTLNAVAKVGSPIISLGIRAEDKSSNSPFKFGIYHAELWMDDSLINAFTLNNFSYDDSRYVNACVDYTKSMTAGIDIQHLSKLPGNKLSIFSDAGSSGIIYLTDTLVHKIKIRIEDAAGNGSNLNFKMQFNKALQKDYMFAQNSVPLAPNQPNVVEGENVKAAFSKNAFYDVVPFVLTAQTTITKNQLAPAVNLDSYTTPVHDSFTVSMKPTVQLNDYIKNHSVIHLQSGKGSDIMKVNWSNGWASTKFKRLGKVELLVDTIKPTMQLMGWKDGAVFTSKSQIRIRCTDEYDDVGDFRAELDGKWLMFAKKSDDFFYNFDEHCSTGKHTLVVTVADRAGNINQQTFTFTKQ